MTPPANPRMQQLRQLAAAIVVTGGLVLVAGVWASRSAALPVETRAPNDGRPPVLQATTPLAPASWSIALWQPLTDVPVQAATSTPFTLSVFSILAQGGTLTAAIDPGDGSGLVYVRTGDTVKGATITAVESSSVTVSSAGTVHQLRLTP